MLTSAGIGSGLDINSLVTNLVNAESAPKTAFLDRQEAQLQTQLSSFGIVKGAMSDLRSTLTALSSTGSYDNRKASSSDKSIFTATADTSAVLANYTIQVSQLAESHKLSSSGFASSSTVVGTGSLTIKIGTDAFTLTIDDSNKSVAGIRDAINNAATNTGVSATLVNVDDGVGGTETRLVLTADGTGSDNAITVTAVNGGEGDLQQLVYDPLPGSGVTNLTQLNPAQDAIILIDTLSVTSSSNTIENAIDGVTLELHKADPAVDHTLTTSLDTEKITSAVESMVDKYNDFIKTMKSLTAYSEGGTSGALLGDALARGILSTVRSNITAQVKSISNSDFSSLAAIGITTNDDDTLSIDTSDLNSVIEDELDTLTNLFTANDGIATVLDDVINDYVKVNGILDSKTDGLNNSINDIGEQRSQLADRMEAYEARLLAQFIAMDNLVQQLTASGDFLTQAISNLPKPNSVKK